MIAAKRIFILAGLAFSLSAAAEPKPGAFDPRVRAELQALVDSWIDAEVRDDRRALEDILHEDFLSTFASGKTLDRAAYIDFIIALDISPFTVRNESIRQHGDTVVVIDVSESGTTKFTWIAVRRDGDWKVISQTFSTVTSAESN